jgi:hypothetical protein
MKPTTEADSGLPRVEEGEILNGPEDTEKPLPLRALLTRPVVVSVANYGTIGLLEITAAALIPIIWSTSVELGELGMSPASVGLLMARYGFSNGLFQFLAFPSIVRRFGIRRIFIASVLWFCPVYVIFPFENLAIRRSTLGVNPGTALLIVLQLSALSFGDMGFGKFPQHLICVRPLTCTDKVRSSCTYPLLPPTGGLLALRMDLRRRWSHFSARSGLLLPRRCLHSHWTTTSWRETLYMLCCSSLCVLGWASLFSSQRTHGNMIINNAVL